MSAQKATRRLTTHDLFKMKANNEKIVMLTAYDSSFGALADAGGVDIILVGDSLGMVVQGKDSTLSVSIEEMAYHTSAVARGSARAIVLADMPFGSFQESPESAFRNAVKLMGAGAHMVKIEGGAEMAPVTKFLSERGIPVCGHIGLTPQSVHQLGGFKVQGKTAEGAEKLRQDALAQQQAGASLLVLEAVPQALSDEVTKSLIIPTIGIGASPNCSGQVLVIYDMLHINLGHKPKFVKNFMEGQATILGGVEAYVKAVKAGTFPSPEHCYLA